MNNTATQSEALQSAIFETPWGPGEVRFAEGQLIEVTLPRTRNDAAIASGAQPHMDPAGTAAGKGGAPGRTPKAAAWIDALEAASRGEAPQWPEGFRPELLVEPGFRREVYRTLLTVPAGIRSLTERLPVRRVTRAPPGRWARPWPPIHCRLSSPVTGWSGPTAALGATARMTPTRSTCFGPKGRFDGGEY